mgnify:FL=1
MFFKYRIFDEDLVKPALVLGFDSQGRGQYRKIKDIENQED